jgi:hypothetical protein
MFKKLSAVDITAASNPANTSPARSSGVWCKRNIGAARSGVARAGSTPRSTSARMTTPMLTHNSASTA